MYAVIVGTRRGLAVVGRFDTYEAAVAEFDSVCHYYTSERVDGVRRDVSVNKCYGPRTFGPSSEARAINVDGV